MMVESKPNEEAEAAGSGRKRRVRELENGKSRQEGVVAELVRLERRIFPKHESLAENLDKELQKRNVSVLYVLEDEFCGEEGNHHLSEADKKKTSSGECRPVAGYLIYSSTSVMASITKLAVRESCRRQGYGEALMQGAIEKSRFKRVLCVNLHVDPLRTPALSLYKKLGFEVDTLVHSYYAANRDAYRMALTFDHDT